MDAAYNTTFCPYVEQAPPRDFGLHTLIIYPFHEAIRNFSQSGAENKSLLQRVTHIVAGVIYLFPVINTILFLALRSIYCKPVFTDERYPIDVEISDEERNPIDTLSRQRDALRQEFDRSNDRDRLNTQIMDLEGRAANLIHKTASSEVVDHLKMLKANDPTFANFDGKTFSKKPREINGSCFWEIPSLSQISGANWLCGYYALFSMLQVATRENVMERTKANAALEDWISLIAIKRTQQYLHGKETIPYGLHLDIGGLSDGEMKYLIEKSAFLTPLRNRSECFYIDLNEFREPPTTFPEPAKLFANSAPATTPPYYFIMKKGYHYYFVAHNKSGHFAITSSLGSYPIDRWEKHDFEELERCLNQRVKASSQTLSLQEA